MQVESRGDRGEASELLSVGFNQDQGCFACGTNSGFRIFNCDPFKQTYRADFANGRDWHRGDALPRNILALVGGGRNPRYPPNKVMIWDDHQNRCIGELSFRSEVKAVRMSRERVVVVLEYKIYVYNFADLNLLHTIETISNPRGLCALCADSRSCVLACSGLQKGHVRIELFDITRTTLVAAHESTLSCLALNLDGTRLATASQRGTLVRLWDTRSGQRLQEAGRGAEAAEIQSIAFSHDNLFMLVSSDHGTIHLFRLGELEPAAAAAAAAAAEPPPGDARPPPSTRAARRRRRRRTVVVALWLAVRRRARRRRRESAVDVRRPRQYAAQVADADVHPVGGSFAQFRLPGSEKEPTRGSAPSALTRRPRSWSSPPTGPSSSAASTRSTAASARARTGRNFSCRRMTSRGDFTTDFTSYSSRVVGIPGALPE